MDIPSKAISFFWKRVAKSSSCWLWCGGIAPNGYGIVYIDFLGNRRSRQMGAHRFSWLIHNGDIPKAMQVRHKCDVKACVNPDHLELGTPSQNIGDALTRGQFPVGERHYCAKLTAQMVRDARRRFFSGESTAKALALEYGVSHAVMHSAIRGKTWKHVKEDV